MPKQQTKWWLVVVWAIGVISLLSLYAFFGDDVREWWLQMASTEGKWLAGAGYVLLLSGLGLFFIPSTPFAAAGVVLFGSWLAYVLNIIGIITSTIVVYYFVQFTGVDTFLAKKQQRHVKRVTKALHHRELPIIIAWSMFPAVPTDAIIYAASGLNISLKKCILGVLLGEGILNLAYILFFSGLLG